MDYKAYFDDSGHEDDPNEIIVAIGGATAPLAKWEIAATRWQRVLDDAKMEKFHTKEFDYIWKKDRDRGNHIIDELTSIVLECTDPVLSYSLIAAYDAARRPLPREPEQRRAHDCVVEWCFDRAITRLHEGDTIHIIVAHTPRYVGRIGRIHVGFKKQHPFKNRVGDIILNHTPTNDIHLQIADLIVSGYVRGLKETVTLDHWSLSFQAKIHSRYYNDCKSIGFDEVTQGRYILDEPIEPDEPSVI